VYFKVGSQYVLASMNGWRLQGDPSSFTNWTPLVRELDGRTVIPDLSQIHYCTKPNSVSGTRPTNGFAVSDITPRFYWKGDVCTYRYELQISTSSSFSNAATIRVPAGSAEYTPSALTDGTYYWRVRPIGFGNQTGKWTGAQKLTIDTTPPSIPNLSSPANGASSNGVPNHSWNSAGGATQYEFRYLTNSGSGISVFAKVTTLTTLKPAFYQTGQLFWQVRASDKLGNWSQWSPERAIYISPGTPGKPKLSTPVNKTVTTDKTPSFYWTEVPYGYKYQIQIARSTSFSASSIVQNQIQTPGDLNYGATTLAKGIYYWRVRSYNINGVVGSWSTTYYFTIK
jgi:hypothetical protein